MTYFFKNDLFWAFNNTLLKTETSYPKSAAPYWLGCRDGQPSHLLHLHLDQLDKPKSSSYGNEPDNLISLGVVAVVYFLLKNVAF